MNHDRIQGRWRQFRGQLREQWGRLTRDDLGIIAGRRERLLGLLQERHGIAGDGSQRSTPAEQRPQRDRRDGS
ncbi:MAG TPA: CsbD family protein [Ramlibacter sp.]|jgi:uncharacterized protein YjbJ (UPF0337 family)|uniref:CsbD family protein n=1 Tax=Ramlibacter sp. TaxID=1917967 RepID=UPI002D74A521|nr:CsbD family protein [Ramlibacter sp.]HZY19432.1 CsbD family protein [Ramlibacter sp.]